MTAGWVPGSQRALGYPVQPRFGPKRLTQTSFRLEPKRVCRETRKHSLGDCRSGGPSDRSLAWRPRYTTPRDARVSPAVAAPAPVAAAEAAAETAPEATMAVTTIAAKVTALVEGILRRILNSSRRVV